MLIHRQATERMISSSAWQTYHQPWEHPHCGITTCVVNGLAWWAKVLQFTWDVRRQKDSHASRQSTRDVIRRERGVLRCDSSSEMCWWSATSPICHRPASTRKLFELLWTASFCETYVSQQATAATVSTQLTLTKYLFFTISCNCRNIFWNKSHVSQLI